MAQNTNTSERYMSKIHKVISTMRNKKKYPSIAKRSNPSFPYRDLASNHLKNNNWNGMRLLNLSESAYPISPLGSKGNMQNKRIHHGFGVILASSTNTEQTRRLIHHWTC